MSNSKALFASNPEVLLNDKTTFDLPNHFLYESVDRPLLYALLTFSDHIESTLIYRTLPIDPYLTRTK